MIVAGVAIVGAALLLLALVHFNEQGSSNRSAQPAVFTPPTSFCSEARRGFGRMVLDVQATTDPALRRDVATVRAGLLRKVANLDDTPTALRRDVRRLAMRVQRAGVDGDFAASVDAATQLDQAVGSTCD